MTLIGIYKTVLKVENLKKWFPVERSVMEKFFSRRFATAVDGIDLEVAEKEVCGLIGESGSGKSTAARLILRLIEPTSGRIFFENNEIFSLKGKDLKKLRHDLQLIQQNSYDSLNARMDVRTLMEEPLRFHGIASGKDESVDFTRDVLTLRMIAERVNRSSKSSGKITM
jgi:ABC-type oligopeptide transport system ATPase subunit